MNKEGRLVVILGPTASGKSTLAVKLAEAFNGEIISADSRQIYRGLNIGTAKITKKDMRGIPHHLLDVVSLSANFSVDRYKRLAEKAITKIQKNGSLPFLVGGTGFYIDAVARGTHYSHVPPNKKLRKELETKDAAELFKILKKLDHRRARTIDHKNPRRLVRAIEIARSPKKKNPEPARNIHPLFIGIQRTPEELRRRIKLAIAKRLKKGLISETKKLLADSVSKRRLRILGLDYRVALDFLEKKITREELPQKLETINWHYAKRQRTWFRRYSDIHWVKNEAEAKKLVRNFLIAAE